MIDGKILITGISGGLGRLVARRLHGVVDVVGIDMRPFLRKPKDLEVHSVDLLRRGAEDIFRRHDIRGVVHMRIRHNPRATQLETYRVNVQGTQNVLEWSSRYGVKKVVMLSSANAYGPMPMNSTFLTEDAPLMGSMAFPAIRALLALDRTGQSYFWKRPNMRTVVLRPVHIVGPHVHNAPSNFLRLRHPPVLMGFDPLVQLLHEDDVVSAILKALEVDVSGIFNIVGPGLVPLRRVLKRLGRRPIPIPQSLALPFYEKMFDWHITSFPTPEFDHIRYPCIVAGKRAREELGFYPSKTMEETIDSLLLPRMR